VALPLIAGLTRAARIAYPFIERGVREGLSSRAIENAIRAGGLSAPRRSVLLEVIRGIKGVEASAGRIENVRRSFKPSPELHAPALTKIRRAYSYTLEVTGSSIGTGMPLTQHIQITSDTPLSALEREEAAAEALSAGESRYGIEVDKIKTTRALRAGSQGVF
jgi:hypothetical protein